MKAMLRSIDERDSGYGGTDLRKVPDIAVRDGRLVFVVTRCVFAAATGAALAVLATAAAAQGVRRLARMRAGRDRQRRARAPSDE